MRGVCANIRSNVLIVNVCYCCATNVDLSCLLNKPSKQHDILHCTASEIMPKLQRKCRYLGELFMTPTSAVFQRRNKIIKRHTVPDNFRPWLATLSSMDKYIYAVFGLLRATNLQCVTKRDSQAEASTSAAPRKLVNSRNFCFLRNVLRSCVVIKFKHQTNRPPQPLRDVLFCRQSQKCYFNVGRF